ncbi:MAG TPA: NDP-sugar synthase [Pyrinomonadaceae bacterium]|nr:NDP-sugar synthase [Pyrinomonadaceae bacterium]
MRAMILSAGYGTRLWPLTEDRTKPAIPILGKPLVGYVAEYLAGYGVDEIIVNLHHRPESVRVALGDGSRFGVALKYIEEPVILGTSGALDNARALLGNETFLVVNGKIVTDIDLRAALATHRQRRALATLVLMRNTLRERFSVVNTRDGLVTGFGGMPGKTADDDPPLMFTGIQIMEPEIFEFIPRGVFSHSTTDVYPQAIARGERIAAHVASGKWRELSTLQRYLDISLEMLRERGETLSVGAGSVIADPANVRDAVIWDKVNVEAGAQVRRAIIADNVHLQSTAVIKDAVVVPKSLIEGKVPPEKALQGHIQGENFVVPLTG